MYHIYRGGKELSQSEKANSYSAARTQKRSFIDTRDMESEENV